MVRNIGPLFAAKRDRNQTHNFVKFKINRQKHNQVRARKRNFKMAAMSAIFFFFKWPQLQKQPSLGGAPTPCFKLISRRVFHWSLETEF